MSCNCGENNLSIPNAKFQNETKKFLARLMPTKHGSVEMLLSLKVF